jgi:hypothetical protein
MHHAGPERSLVEFTSGIAPDGDTWKTTLRSINAKCTRRMTLPRENCGFSYSSQPVDCACLVRLDMLSAHIFDIWHTTGQSLQGVPKTPQDPYYNLFHISINSVGQVLFLADKDNSRAESVILKHV